MKKKIKKKFKWGSIFSFLKIKNGDITSTQKINIKKGTVTGDITQVQSIKRHKEEG